MWCNQGDVERKAAAVAVQEAPDCPVTNLDPPFAKLPCQTAQGDIRIPRNTRKIMALPDAAHASRRDRVAKFLHFIGDADLPEGRLLQRKLNDLHPRSLLTTSVASLARLFVDRTVT